MGAARDRVQRFVGDAWDQAKRPLYRNAFFILIASIIGAALGFFFWIIAYRVYNPDDAGFAITMFNTMTFLAGVGSLGLPIALIRFLPDSEEPADLINTSLSVAGLLTAVLAIVFMIGLPIWALSLVNIFGRAEYFLIIPVTAMAFAFGPVLDQAVIGLRRADLFLVRTVVFAGLKMPLPLVFVAVTPLLGGILGLYMSFAVAFVVSVLVLGYVLLRRILPGYHPRPRLSKRLLRPMFAFSIGNWLAAVIANAGVLLLTLLITNTLAQGVAAAVFYAAMVISGLLATIPSAAMTSLYAEASHRNSDRRGDERRAILLSTVLLLPGIVAMWFLADRLLGLFGRVEYIVLGTVPLQILTLNSIPAFLNNVYGTRVRVRKQVIPLIVSSAIGTAVTLALGFFLLVSNGIVGLAIAVLVGHAASTPYLFAVAGKPLEEEPMAAPTVPP